MLISTFHPYQHSSTGRRSRTNFVLCESSKCRTMELSFSVTLVLSQQAKWKDVHESGNLLSCVFGVNSAEEGHHIPQPGLIWLVGLD